GHADSHVLFQNGFDIPCVGTRDGDVRILIEGRKGRRVLAGEAQRAVRKDALRIADMDEDFFDRPFAGLVWSREFLFGERVDEGSCRFPVVGQVLKHLRDNRQATRTFIHAFPEEKLPTPHQPGEWTIKEILVHVSDTERIFAYRALRFARQDATALSAFNQDAYVPVSRANTRDIETILEEYMAVRMATMTLFESFEEEVYVRRGIASENRVSIRALVYMIAGHELHHRNSIRENYRS